MKCNVNTVCNSVSAVYSVSSVSTVSCEPLAQLSPFESCVEAIYVMHFVLSNVNRQSNIQLVVPTKHTE